MEISSNYINANVLKNSVFELFYEGKKNRCKKIVVDLLPLLSLNTKTAAFSHVGLVVCRITDFDWKNGKQIAKNLVEIAAYVGYVGLSILAPKTTLAFSSSYEIYKFLHSKETKLKKISEVIHQLIYVASVYSKNPILTTLSLVLQASKEIYESTAGGRQRPKSLKEIVNFIVGCVRLYNTAPQLEKAYRDQFGKKLTQEDWDQLISEDLEDALNASPVPVSEEVFPIAQQTKVVSIQKRLKQKNFSSIIDGIKIEPSPNHVNIIPNPTEINTPPSSIHLKMSDMIFNNCIFDGIVFSTIDATNTVFNRCSIRDPQHIDKTERVFKNFHFTHVLFNECDLSYSVFVDCVFGQVVFNQCNLSTSIFAFSKFHEIQIISSNIECACFWANKIIQSTIEDCRLLNVFLLEAEKLFSFKNCSKPVFDKPVVLFPTHFKQTLRFAPKIIHSLRKLGILLLPFDSCPRDIDLSDLKKEILDGLDNVMQEPSSNMLSRADEILKRAKPGSLLDRIQQQTSSLVDMSHGILIPGGDDIPNEFYRNTFEFLSKCLEDLSNYGVTITELAVLKAALSTNKPVLGICRGHQLINVYFGGTLRDVQGHRGAYQELNFQETPPAAQLKRNLGINDPFIAFSCHTQAIDILGQGIDIICKVGDVIKMIICRGGRVIGSQFHPEISNFIKTVKDYKKDLKEENSTQMSPSTFDSFIENNKKIYQLFVDQVCSFFRLESEGNSSA